MPEPLTTQLLREELEKLIIAFPRTASAPNPMAMADVYRNGLSGLSGDSIRFAVNRAIQEDEHFPKVARLREIATEWSRRTNAVIERMTSSDSADELRCHVCGAVATDKTWERRKMRITQRAGHSLDHYEWELDEKGQPIWEEVFIKDHLVMTHDARKHGIFSSEAA